MTPLRCSSVLMIVLVCQYLFETCVSKPYNCTPSACGIIRDISYPFRLKNDPKHCGDRVFELACENNVTVVYLYSQKYYVKAINYHNSTIRLVDAALKNDICSFPNSSSAYNFTNPFPDLEYPYQSWICNSYHRVDLAWPINFMSCPTPLMNNNSSLLTDITHHCASNISSSPRFTYIKVGHMNASDVTEMCRVELIVLTSWKFKDLNTNISLSEIHHSLLYGFQLHFFDFSEIYAFTNWGNFVFFFFGRLKGLLLIPLVILVFVSAGGSLSVMFIIGFIGLLGILSFILIHTLYGPGPTALYTVLSSIALLVGIISRFIICPYVVWVLIYKFRSRHLSVFHAIESFLQSDNNLMPIRYSYSDIKKMTKGFKDKLGEGGYGSVYKGRLRSGHDVAVKLLGKSGANGNDFINEIATIGRIHHINVVKLVGYCAQGSKRALVFDFMSNGSLEKYLFRCNIQILHFDIKPHNILLDDKFIPKISDFGLAKFCSTNKNTMTLTTARGTIGYVAPELINRSIGAVSYKADVYSFGMVLMEMMNPSDRPTMSKVLEMLECDVEHLQMPNYPSQSSCIVVNEANSWDTHSTDSISLLYHNDASGVEITIEE
ncbi:hypothetical protein C2S52_009010 [Perilla frutescens var. hirtella]|nr:hypothetical protein C2S52_009010 [Perilla frutescens var. hirtella]